MVTAEAPAAPGRRERNNQERRARLLTQARRLFDAQGVEATTIEQIAAAADLSPRTVYNFFDTKIDLVAALLSSEIRSRVRAGAAADPVGEDVVADLLAVVDVLIGTMKSTAKVEQRLVMARALMADGDCDANRYVAEIDSVGRGLIRDRLARHVAAGTLPADLDADELGAAIFALLNGLYLGWLQSENDLAAIRPMVAGHLEHLFGGALRR